MKRYRCKFCGSEIDAEDSVCPYCGNAVEPKLDGESNFFDSLYERATKSETDSASWVRSWQRKVNVSRLLTVLILALIMLLPTLPLIIELAQEPRMVEVCKINYDVFNFDNTKNCHMEENPTWGLWIGLLSFEIILLAILSAIAVFSIRLEIKYYGGSTVVVYRGAIGCKLIIDGLVADSISGFAFRRTLSLSGVLANGDSLTVILPYRAFFRSEFIVGGRTISN